MRFGLSQLGFRICDSLSCGGAARRRAQRRIRLHQLLACRGERRLCSYRARLARFQCRLGRCKLGRLLIGVPGLSDRQRGISHFHLLELLACSRELRLGPLCARFPQPKLRLGVLHYGRV